MWASGMARTWVLGTVWGQALQKQWPIVKVRGGARNGRFGYTRCEFGGGWWSGTMNETHMVHGGRAESHMRRCQQYFYSGSLPYALDVLHLQKSPADSV